PNRAIKIHRRRFFDPDHRLVPIFVSGPAAFSYVRLLSSSGSLAIFAAIRRALTGCTPGAAHTAKPSATQQPTASPCRPHTNVGLGQTLSGGVGTGNAGAILPRSHG